MRRFLQRRPRLSDQRGFTLIELLMAGTIGLIVLGAATLITIGAARHNGEVANRADATQRGRLAMERMVQSLRSQVCTTASTFPIVTAKTDSVTFFADLSDGSKGPVRHTYTLTPATGILADTAEQGSVSTPTTFAAGVTTRLATDVLLPASGSLFRYYRYPTPAPATGNLEPNVELVPPAGGTLSATAVGQIARIDINFLTTGATRSTKNIKAEMTDQVFVRLSDPNDTTSSFNPSCS